MHIVLYCMLVQTEVDGSTRAITDGGDGDPNGVKQVWAYVLYVGTQFMCLNKNHFS